MRKMTLNLLAHTAWRFLILAGALCSIGCGSTSVIDEGERTVAILEPLVIASDSRLTISLEWILVRNGLGSWCKDADWDEYILTITNRSEETLRIESVRVVDSLGDTVVTSGKYKNLVKQSKQTARRYKEHDIEVKAGFGGDNLMQAGNVVAAGSAVTGVAVLGGSVGATAAATGAAIGGFLIVAPVLLTVGAVSSANEAKIAREIIDRHAELPHRLTPSQTETLHFFFPITPSPTQLEVLYRADVTEYALPVDTGTALNGLHVGQ